MDENTQPKLDRYTEYWKKRGVETTPSGFFRPVNSTSYQKKPILTFQTLEDYHIHALATEGQVHKLDTYVVDQVKSTGGGSFTDGVKYSITYQVHNPTGVIGAQNACNSVNWSYGWYYNNEPEGEDDNRAICTSINGDEVSEDGCTRMVVVEFQQISIELLNQMEFAENPLAVPVRYSFEAQQEGDQIQDRDINGRAIRNKAGDKFADGIVEPTYTGVLKVTKNFATNPYFFLYYMNKVNSDVFAGFSPKTLKMINASEIEAQFSPDFGEYYPMTFHFAFKPEGWKHYPLNEGYRERDSDGKLVIIKDDKGNPTTEPMLLDGSGKKAGTGASAIYLDFETTYSLPFGDITG